MTCPRPELGQNCQKPYLTPKDYDKSTIRSSNGFKIEFQENNEEYGGGLSSTLIGYSGEYDLTSGFYICLNAGEEERDFSLRFQRTFNFGLIDWKASRSLIISFTTYNVPTEFYTTVQLLFELDASR